MTNWISIFLKSPEVKYVKVSKASLEKYQVRKGDIVFNNTNSPELVGKTAYFDLDNRFVISNHMTRLRTKPELIEAEFLARYLHYLWQIGLSTRWAKHWVNQAAIDQKGLAQVPVPLPPLPEQEHIVTVLRQADELRRLRQQAVAKADALLAAIFHDMFGDPARNPHGWKLNKLSKVGKLDRGRSRHRPRDAAHLYGGPYPFIQTGDVANSNGWITEYRQTYSEAGLEQSKLWDAGTLCITIAANIAKTGILTFDACFPDSIVGFIPYDEVTVEYVHQWFVAIQNRLEEIAPRAAQKNINLRILRNLSIPVPPKPLLDQFTAYVERTRNIVVEQEKSTEHSEKLFGALLARAFSGELTAVWRDRHLTELQESAVRRDIALGLREETPRLIDFEEGRVTPMEEEEFRQQINQLMKSVAQELVDSLGFTQDIAVAINQHTQPSLMKMAEAIQPALPRYETLVENLLAESVSSINRMTQETLAANYRASMALQSVAESILRPQSLYESLGRRILALVDAQVRQAAQLPLPQPDRTVYPNLDELSEVMLRATRAMPVYFEARDLHNLLRQYGEHFRNGEDLDLVQVESSLNLLASLGFVRFVELHNRLVYRLVEPMDDGALLPEELG